MRASILHLSSNVLFKPVQTEPMTLCFSLVRVRAAGPCELAAGVAIVAIKGVAARGAAAMPTKNSLRSMLRTIPAFVRFCRQKSTSGLALQVGKVQRCE